MMKPRAIYHLMKADFLQRIRSSGFVVILGLAIFVSYLFVPPATENFLTLGFGPRRGIYNSAWVGTMYGVFASFMLPLFTFYFVKNAIERDRDTRVGQIIAATPISKPAYIIGKWLSNLAVLSVILLILTGMAVVMQLLRAEDMTIIFSNIVLPIWLMGLPMMALVSAAAVFFESVPFLQGG
ncbi:MAG: hypothetical protein N2D54_09375, partial [Chloroflexota bacterium]